MKSKRAPQEQQSEPPTTLLNLRNVEDLHWEMQQVQLAIARRAYELFETGGCEHGHDWEDWFRRNQSFCVQFPFPCRSRMIGLVFALIFSVLTRMSSKSASSRAYHDPGQEEDECNGD